MLDRDLGELFERFRSRGDAGALGAVFDATAPDLLRIARRVTRDRAEAEDLLQTTFLSAIERAPTFERGRSLRPWLVGILVRQAGLARRRKSRTTESRSDPSSTSEAPEALASERELFEAVTIALSKLSDSDREVLVPLLLDGRRAVDIARELERRPDTVHMRIHRGLLRLRRLLPTGFAFGLASVRRDVLRAARAHSGQSAAAVSTAATLGGTLLVNKFALSSAALLVAATAGWLAWPEGDSGPSAPFTARAGASDPALDPGPHAETHASFEVGPTPHESDRTSIDPNAAETAEIQFVGADGGAAAELGVAVVAADSSVRALTTDAEGRISLEATRERIEIVAGRPDRFPMRAQIVLEAGVHRIELERGRAVSGRVRVRGAPPERPLVIKLYSTSPPLADLESVAAIAQAIQCDSHGAFLLAQETSADGTFRWSGLPEAWSGGLTVPYTYTLLDAPAGSFGNQGLRLDTPLEDLAIDLEKLPCVRGRVIEARGGHPVPKSRITCRATWSVPGSTTEIGGTSDDAGRFELPLQTRGFRSLQFSATDADGRGNAPGTFLREELGPDLDVGDLLLERPPSRDVPFVVRDLLGNPIPKALASAPDLVSPPTDDTGRSTLLAVPTSAKELRDDAHGFWAKTFSIPEVIDAPIEVVLEPGNELWLEIDGIPQDRTERVELHLLCTEPPFANHGGWLPGWIVREARAGDCWSASPKEGRVACEFGERGQLVLEDLRPGLPITLQVIGSFEQVLLETVVPGLERSERRRVALRYPEPKCVLTGRVAGEDGRPLGRVSLVLRRDDGQTDGRATSPDGRFVFSLHEPGNFLLTAVKSGWAGEERSVSVGEGPGMPIEFRLHPSRHVVVDVVGPRGERIPGARLEACPPPGFVAPSAREDRAGRLHFDDFPPAASRLRLLLAGEELERPVDPLVRELRIEVPAYGRVEFTCDPTLLPPAESDAYPMIVLRPIDSSREPLVHWNLAELPGEFPFAWPGDYTLGLELYTSASPGTPERWRVLRPAVPVHVEPDRTASVSLGP